VVARRPVYAMGRRDGRGVMVEGRSRRVADEEAEGRSWRDGGGEVAVRCR
jgi:hypothetical protein